MRGSAIPSAFRLPRGRAVTVAKKSMRHWNFCRRLGCVSLLPALRRALAAAGRRVLLFRSWPNGFRTTSGTRCPSGRNNSKAANIGISLPGTGEEPSCPVYIDGQKFTTLKGNHQELSSAFQALVDDY